MSDEAKALVERLRYTAEHGIFTAHDNGMQAMPGEVADLIETQAREIARLREALEKIVALEDDFESNAAMTAHEWQMFHTARAALGDSHE